MNVNRRGFSAGFTAGLGVLLGPGRATAQANTVKIGMTVPVTGAAAAAGVYAVNGAKLALTAVNKTGGVFGMPVELIIEDDQTTNPGIILAFSKLTAQPDIVAVLGPSRSTQVHAIVPDIAKFAKPVLIGATDPTLTRLGNPWLFRFRPNDNYSARVIADCGVNTLAKRKWAVVHSTDAYGTAGGSALTEALRAFGVTPVLDQGYANQSQDFSAVVAAVKQSGADVLGSYFTFETDLGIFARQLRQLGVNIPWVGSASIDTVTALKLAGPALYGTYGASDFAEESSEGSKTFGNLYRRAYSIAPDNLSAWTYDAITVLCANLNKVGSADVAAVRKSILETRKFAGAEGEYNFDQNGDGLHCYNLVRNEKGTIVFDKHVDYSD